MARTHPAASGENKQKLFLAYLTLVLVQLLYCIWHVLGKKAMNDGLNPFVLAMYRQDGALIVMAGLARFVDKELAWRGLTSAFGRNNTKISQVEQDTESRIHMNSRDRWGLALLGLLGFGNIYGFIVALSMVTSFNSALLHPTIPVASALIASLSGIETATKRTMIGVTFGAFGALIVVLFGVERDKANTEGDSHGFSRRRIAVGNAFLLGQCLCMGALLVLQKALNTRTNIPSTTLTALYNWIAAFFATLSTLLLVPRQDRYFLHTSNEIAAVIYGAVIGICIIYVLLGWAAVVAGPTVVALSMTLQPPLNAVLAVLFLGRTSFSLGEILGGLVIIAGLLVVVLQKKALPSSSDDNQQIHTAVLMLPDADDNTDRTLPLSNSVEPSPNEYNDLLRSSGSLIDERGNFLSSSEVESLHETSRNQVAKRSSSYAPLAVDHVGNDRLHYRADGHHDIDQEKVDNSHKQQMINANRRLEKHAHLV